ncbi:hypothetical protein [Bdellovibrio sp. HCB209]|uniref:hypothetical protein n=1 Tax=Bdellovibrio sp. HCB209 TaxID=3394354 RepID=UPI0039B456C2
MKHAALVLLTALFVSPSVFASSVVKVMDGSVAYCNEGTTHTKGKFVSIGLIDESSSQTSKDVTVRVSMVKCQQGAWIADSQPSVERYTAPNGVKVKTSYSNYELLVVDKNFRVLMRASLQDLNAGSFQDQSVSIDKSELPQAYELIIRTQRSVNAENGVKYSERINFGIFRLHARN